MGPAARPDRPQRFDRGALGRRVPRGVRAAPSFLAFSLRRIGRDDNLFGGELPHALPWDAPAALFGGQALDETRRPADQRDDFSAIRMHLVHVPECLAI